MLPGVPIVWGGYFPSQHADACLSESTVDVCVVGQGEQHDRRVDARAHATAVTLSSVPGSDFREERRDPADRRSRR